VLKVYKEYAFRILKRYKTLLGRKRLTRRLLYRLFHNDRQFIYFPDSSPEVIFDPYGEKLEEYLKKKAGVM